MIEILTSVSYSIYDLLYKEAYGSDIKEKNEEARVHFIPYLKEGVFVTLCAPVVIKKK
ncbi:MAG TPA: hypothetical protein VFM18_01095 [Methanosarcina sp.]|nr:hypothetical protein [Methanosarcina sp.]